MPFAKKRIFIHKPRSQPNFSKKLSAKPELIEPLLDEIVRDFDKLKRHYMRSKGMNVPPTPTAQLEIVPDELILADTTETTETTETVTAVPVPAETRKKTTEKQLVTMSMMPRRTTRTRKTTSKHKTPTSKQRTPSKRRRTPSKHTKHKTNTTQTSNT